MVARDAQRDATRARIVDAVCDLVAEAHPAALSMPAVARRAGVGVATVYRYFPTKEALLDAAATEVFEGQADAMPTSLAHLEAGLRTTWRELAKRLPLVRNQWASPLGRELHRRRWGRKRFAMSAGLLARGVDPVSPEGQRLVGIADVLTSSTALLEIHDKAGVDVDQAAAWCAWAVQTLLRSTQRQANR